MVTSSPALNAAVTLPMVCRIAMEASDMSQASKRKMLPAAIDGCVMQQSQIILDLTLWYVLASDAAMTNDGAA